MDLTPSQTVGPFYHLGLIDARWAPAIEAATPGQRIRIQGCVLDGDGAPVIDGMLESWQADAGGIYRHPKATAGHPLPNDGFTGFHRGEEVREVVFHPRQVHLVQDQEVRVGAAVLLFGSPDLFFGFEDFRFHAVPLALLDVGELLLGTRRLRRACLPRRLLRRLCLLAARGFPLRIVGEHSGLAARVKADHRR